MVDRDAAWDEASDGRRQVLIIDTLAMLGVRDRYLLLLRVMEPFARRTRQTLP